MKVASQQLSHPELATRLDLAYSNWPTTMDDGKAFSLMKIIDAHTEGEPVRVFMNGLPELKGKHILERRRLAQDQYDHIRRLLLLEPRGHADMYGAWILPPNEASPNDTSMVEADFSVLLLNNEGYSSMCGHAVIGVTKVVVDLGLVENMGQEKPTIVNIDTPAGRIVSSAQLDNHNLVSKVSFENVPSYAVALDQRIIVDDELGEIKYDLAFGGAYYVYVDINQVKEKFTLIPAEANRLRDYGMRIKRAIMKKVKIEHPEHAELSILHGVMFVGKPLSQGSHSRNVCVFANGEVDRSPCGTGVSGRAAVLHARGELQIGESIVIESILGTTFSVTPVRKAPVGKYNGLVPKVTGRAYITGKHEFLVDPNDPLRDGFILR